MTLPKTSHVEFSEPAALRNLPARSGLPDRGGISSDILPVAAWGANAASYAVQRKGLLDKTTERTGEKCLEKTVAYYGDRALEHFTQSRHLSLLDKCHLNSPTLKSWGKREAFCNRALNGGSLFGVSFDKLASKVDNPSTFWGNWKAAVRDNFKGIRNNLQHGRVLSDLPKNAPPLTVRNYLRHAVIGEHTRKAGAFLTGQGGAASMVISVLPPAFMLWSTVKMMRKAHALSQARRECFILRMYKTAAAGTKELFRGIASYHIGSLVFPFAAALFPFAGVRIAAGLAGAIATGILSNRLITKVIGEPVQ